MISDDSVLFPLDTSISMIYRLYCMDIAMGCWSGMDGVSKPGIQVVEWENGPSALCLDIFQTDSQASCLSISENLLIFDAVHLFCERRRRRRKRDS